MGLFDKLNNKTPSESSKSNELVKGKVTITFAALPESLAEMKALPEASLDSPFKTAALTICALCAYAADADIGIEMLNWLKGPEDLSAYDKSFLKDRYMQNKHYVPFSYFAGAVPANDYTPSTPFTITIEAGPYAYDNEGYATLSIASGGADNPRTITLRKKASTGEWFVNNYAGILLGIRKAKSEDAWA